MSRPARAVVSNFGRNVRFTPRRRYRPATEAEVLGILHEHRRGTVRVVGSGHSWSPGIESRDALVDLRRLRAIRVHDDRKRVSVGGGCRIGPLLAHLNRRGLTLPSIGLIDRQTVGGAIATGTHGSGRQSMSHQVEALRIACYGPDGQPRIRVVESGIALRAARCSLGTLGVVVEVTLRCVPQYHVRERCVWLGAARDALRDEADHPLRQLYLIPHSWNFLAHERRVATRNRRDGAAALYRVYWLLLIDVLLHVGVKLSASLLRSRRLVHLLYRHALPACIFPGWRVTDRSDRQLLMRHDLFRHLEMEAFVTRTNLEPAIEIVADVLRAADDASHEIEPAARARIERLGLRREFEALRGTHVHHYPICIRRVLPDDTLLSMSSGHGREPEDWYAVSLITYTEPRDPFLRVARFLATVLSRDLGARLHWGKWFPLGAAEVARAYPGLAAFLAVRAEFDPDGVFSNDFLDEVLGGAGALGTVAATPSPRRP